MKSLIPIILFIVFNNTYAQWGVHSLKAGHFSPTASDAGGFIVGYEGGREYDRNFIVSWSIDWFHKSYVDKKLVNDFNTIYGIGGGSLNELRAKTNIHDFPFMINISAFYPVAPRVRLNLTGGIGAEVLIIHYRNFQNPDEADIKGAFDFNWRIGAGASFNIGPRSEIFTELGYHSSAPSWEYEVQDPVTRTERVFERIYDMSGFLARVGVRFYY